jgi:hypothetical protein
MSRIKFRDGPQKPFPIHGRAEKMQRFAQSLKFRQGKNCDRLMVGPGHDQHSPVSPEPVEMGRWISLKLGESNPWHGAPLLRRQDTG